MLRDISLQMLRLLYLLHKCFLFFDFHVAQLVADVIKVIISKAKHLLDSAEQQDVAVWIQLQLLAVVLHRNNTGQRHTEPSADLLHLDHQEFRWGWFIVGGFSPKDYRTMCRLLSNHSLICFDLSFQLWKGWNKRSFGFAHEVHLTIMFFTSLSLTNWK